MQKVLAEIDDLISQAQFLESWQRGQAQETPNVIRQRYAQFNRTVTDVLCFIGLEDHLRIIRSHTSNSLKSQHSDFSGVLGALYGIKNSLQKGFVGNIRFLLHAEIFDSLVDQAEGLLKTGHMLAAAVLGRIVIERWLRDEAEKASIPDFGSERASMLNEALKKCGVFSKPKWSQIQSFLAVGNAAAHGNEAEFTEQDVRRVLDFAKVNCI